MNTLIGDIGNTITKICLIEDKNFKIKKIIYFNSREFLIIGIGVNIVSNPNINTSYKATNILMETKQKPTIKEVINLIIFSYENFFTDLNFIFVKKLKRFNTSLLVNSP